MKKQKLGLTMFWIGLLVASTFAGIIGRSLYHHLRTLTMEELSATPWAEGGPLFILWALSVTLGSIVAGIGAFVYANTKAVFSWLAGIGVLGAVIAMVIVWSRIYDSTLILRRFDQVQPSPALVSEDVTIAAQQRMLEDWSDESFYWYNQALRWSSKNEHRTIAQNSRFVPALVAACRSVAQRAGMVG